MDTTAFVEIISHEFAAIKHIEKVAIQTEGPVVKSRAYLSNDLLITIYHNVLNETLSVALLLGSKRVWGIDFDHIRGWHLHPVENPGHHELIGSQTIPMIFETLTLALENFLNNDQI